MDVKLADLLRAIQGDEIIPYFQPLVELRTGQLIGFEVLARWKRPNGETRLPTNFISLAEEQGVLACALGQSGGKRRAISEGSHVKVVK